MQQLSFLLASFLLIGAGCSKNDNGTIVTIPASPTGLTATVISASQVNLQWTDNSSNERGYKLERKKPGESFVQIASTGVDVVLYSDVNLSPATAYTYRVIAYNSDGNSLDYSNAVTVTTPGLTVNPPTTTICNQVWSSRNLSVGNYRNGDLIPQVTDAAVWQNLITGAWCWYNNDSVNYSKYGKLYNWHAVNDPRGLAPQGWHIPTNTEWNLLTKCLYPNADTTQCCDNSAGQAMKSTSGWGISGLGDNSSGFNALPGGYRIFYGPFNNEGYYGIWWSSTPYYNESDAYARSLDSISSTLTRYVSDKSNGFSVRIVKD